MHFCLTSVIESFDSESRFPKKNTEKVFIKAVTQAEKRIFPSNFKRYIRMKY